LLSSAGRVLEQRVRGCAAIKNLLVYQSGDLQLSLVSHAAVSAPSFSLSCPPDQASIRLLMEFIDKAGARKRYDKQR
jgi:hypothetical protein